jgi:hypothetical protein
MLGHEMIGITRSNHTERRRPMRIIVLEGHESPGANSGRGADTSNNRCFQHFYEGITLVA